MTSAARFTEPDNWNGGFYELAIEVGETSDNRLGLALAALWRAAEVRGCYGSGEQEPHEQQAVSCTIESLERFGHLRGVVNLPGDRVVVCGAVAVREDRGTNWLDFYLPLGAVARADDRVGAFPFGDDGGPASLAWREPIDTWFSGIGIQVYAAADYRLGLIGFEASGQVRADEIDGDPQMPGFGYLLPDSGGVRYVRARS